MRWLAGLIASSAVVGTLVVVSTSTDRGHGQHEWSTQHVAGNTRLHGEVPLPVSRGIAAYVRAHPSKAVIKLNFGFPLRDRAALDKLIAKEAATHTYLSRDELYTRFSPPNEQIDALRAWLQANGFTITHVGLDRTAIAASATTAAVQKALHVKINDYIRPAFQFHAVKVKPFVFYSNTSDPTLPARFGVQTISGLSDVDRFFTSVQLSGGATGGKHATSCDDEDNAVISPLCVDVHSGGYFPTDLRSMYDVSGHGFDGTGQTLGFTLWGAMVYQSALTSFSTSTGDQLITADPPCTATGNSPTVPSSCTTTVVGGDHLLSILENGNTNDNFGTNGNLNVETSLDVEQAHGIATHAAMKYYLADCTTSPPAGSGLTNGSNCNGSDVGLEEAIEDAANDPTLHTVSNSWGFGGEAEWAVGTDPFMTAADNSFAIAAAAGTTFYFSTGDSGTYFSGYPADSKYVVGVGGTTLFSTGTTAPFALSTENTWAAGGSWCSNIISRPSWQNGPGVTANAQCPGRVVPDISAIADPNSSVRVVSTTNLTGGTQSGGFGGTSVAAPELNGLQAVTQNFIAAQTYPGATPQLGFVGPLLYQLGNGGHYDSYYRDVYCGNTANPSAGPDGDAAQSGWDAATGWGAPDWFNMSTGFAIALGATNLSVPASLSRNYSWTCAKTPGNSTERGLSFPTSSVGFAVGTASGATPWYAKFLPAASWGVVNTFYKTTDGGLNWLPANSDMMGIACMSASSCVEVGDGGRIKTTTDSGTTWTDQPKTFNKALTQVRCPGAGVCYAVGDRGTLLKSTDGGATWFYLPSVDGNPLYGLACPNVSTCYATDIYARITKTTDGGASWTMQTTPVTTPGVAVPGSGGPNPFAGLMAISCSDASTCVASGLYVVPGGQTIPSIDPPIITTTDGGTTWTLRTSNGGALVATTTTLSAATAAGSTNIKVASVSGFVAGQPIIVDSGGANPETVTITSVGTAGAGGTGVSFTPALAFAHASGATVAVTFAPNYLHGISCLPGTTTCTAVGRAGAIVTTTNLTTWTRVTSGTTNMLNSVTCLGTSFCMAVGQSGTIDVFNGTTWTATTGNGGGAFLASVTCLDTTTCYIAGKQGVTLATTNGGATWTQQAGGGTTVIINGISCPTDSVCFAAGNAGTILKTANGGQTWLAQPVSSLQPLNGIACTSATACVVIGAAGGSTTLAAAASVGATNIKVASVAGFIPGQLLTIDSGAAAETVTITTIGTAGATGTGISFSPALALAHASGATVVGQAAARYTTDGSTWINGTAAGGNTLNAVACSSPSTCVAVGAAGTIRRTTDGGATWPPVTSGTTLALNAVTCVGSTCFATGAAAGTNAVMLKSLDSGATWSSLVTNSNSQALNAISCVDASNCFAAGALGTVVATTDGGATWTQAGNPLSGPTNALNNTGPAALLAIQAAACTPARCTLGTASSGNIMTTPLLTVRVNTTSVYGTPPGFGAIGPTSPSVSFDPASEAGNVTGFMSCASTATSSSDVGTYPISSCFGFADDGFSVVYDYTNSSHTVTKAPQTITFEALADKTYGDPDFDVSATSSSGFSVSFGATGNCTVSGATVHITGGGPCSITASQGGSGNFKPAPDVTQSFAIRKADQSITFGTLNDGTFGDADFSVSATATSGLTVALHASGPCTLSSPTSPANAHISGAGSCSITASQAGNDNYSPAPDEVRSFSIAKASQHITFGALADKTYGDPDFTVSATASSGLTVSFGATGNCTVTGVTVHITDAGSCSITASQGGDGNFDPAPDVTRSFVVAKADQTITFDQPADHTYGDADFGVSPSASSGLAVSLVLAPGGACTLSGTTVHIVTAGSCSLTASQSGDSNFNPAPDVTRTFAVHKADQTITFAAILDKTWGEADFSIAPTAGSGLDVTVASTGNCHLVGFTVHITGAGSCSITASQAGNGNYNAAPDVTRSFAINKADQTITFPAISDKTYGDPDIHIDAAASSRLDVALASTGPCTLSAGIAPALAHIIGTGTCSITASQAGDSNFNPAVDVTRSFVVHKANQTITFAPIPTHTFGDADFTLAATASSGLAVSYAASGDCTVSGATVHITASGSCTITASQAGNGNYNAAPNVSRSFSITNTFGGRVEGAGVKPSNGGNASFHVEAARDGLKGNLSYEGPEPAKTKPPTKKVHFEADKITSFSIAADGQSAWFAGLDKDGHPFLVYVEDNGKKNKPSRDVFKLWIDGVLQTPISGGIDQGKVEIKP